MATIWVREFTGGLDTRRMPEATTGGVLVRARNGHITRGGEFEQRAAFVPTFQLPAGTVGMASSPQVGVVVFGHTAAPSGIPPGVTYQRLQHPTSSIALTRVLSTDLYAGKIYAVGEFADGSIFHFYNGTRVTDWFDGRARATFTVTSGHTTPAQPASASFAITGGTEGVDNTIDAVLVDGVNITGTPIPHTGDNVTTAAAVASRINSLTTSPNYTATSNGQTVVITAAIAGVAANNRAVVPSVTGDVTVSGNAVMSGGANSVTSSLNSLRVANVNIIGAPVMWQGDNEATATAIAAAINSHTSSPAYTATVAGASVSIAAAVAGTAANGRAISFGLANGLTVSPTSLSLANGAASTNTYQPGEFVKTIGTKEYSVSGPNLHFSGIKEPTKWTTDTIGAGFIDMSSENSGSEELTAIARYQNLVAVFAPRAVQIWYMDPDPELNKQSQVLNNTGTGCPHSVTEFGDIDLFYLDESGLRSLRARDSSNAAATTDIGVPVDGLITAKLNSLTENERQQVTGLIEPRNGRFWLVMRDTVFVFSFFNGAKVSAWSTYDTSFVDNNGNTVKFSVDNAMVHNRRVYLRSGHTIFVYGGTGAEVTFDATEAEAWTPYMDADDPTRTKEFNGLDIASRGLWQVSAAMNILDDTAEDLIGIFEETTYAGATNYFAHHATHISLRFRSLGQGPHRLGACVIHYDSSTHDD